MTSRAPSPFSHVVDSQATTPPPTTSTRSGSSRMLVTSRDVHGLASRKPSTGGTVAVLPVATTTAWRASKVRVEPSGSVSSTVFSPARRALPLTTSIPAPLAHFTWLESSW